VPVVEGEEQKRSKPSVRARADAIKQFVCKNLIAVIEDPSDIKNIGTVIRNVNALGVEKVYVVDPRKGLPDNWQEMRQDPALSKPSVSAVKWSFVKRFDSTDECFDYLEKNNFRSIVTSPHVKGQVNIICMKATTPSTPNWRSGLATKSGVSPNVPLNAVMLAFRSRCSG
jgi:tRNA (guanosine-2'-O-)-methyltransferase